MHNVGIVVEDLTATVAFFGALGLTLEDRQFVEGEWAGKVTGLGDQRVEIAMMRTPTGTVGSSCRASSSRASSPTTAGRPSMRSATCARCSPSTTLTTPWRVSRGRGRAGRGGRGIRRRLPAVLRARP
ncbi:VOC family protein [Tessaracoccus coleopterorum]|uniref:hypothetical protein n=1 Tax=Tessaracoccus coleopterorum TaxID=2714950 RepID=UPI001E48F0D9|nr:hypothetical protein [Tessaracoccus coleopterorum]